MSARPQPHGSACPTLGVHAFPTLGVHAFPRFLTWGSEGAPPRRRTEPRLRRPWGRRAALRRPAGSVWALGRPPFAGPGCGALCSPTLSRTGGAREGPGRRLRTTWPGPGMGGGDPIAGDRACGSGRLSGGRAPVPPVSPPARPCRLSPGRACSASRLPGCHSRRTWWCPSGGDGL